MRTNAVIENMFKNTNEDGKLIISPWPEETDRYGSGIYRCIINWEDNSPDKAISKFNNLLDTLSEISEYYFDMEETLDFGEMPDFVEFSAPIYAECIWDDYIYNIGEVIDNPEGLRALANERFGKNMCGEFLLRHAFQYCKISADAQPGTLYQMLKEQELMAKAFIINNYAEVVEYIDIFHDNDDGETIMDALEDDARLAEIIYAMKNDPSIFSTPRGGYLFLAASIFCDQYSAIQKNILTDYSAFKLKLDEALATIPDYEKSILTRLYGLEDGTRLTTNEIGKSPEYNLTGDNIDRIYIHAMRMLKMPNRKINLG